MEDGAWDKEAAGASLAASRGTLEATRWSPIQHARVAEVEKERCIIFAVCSILRLPGSKFTVDAAVREAFDSV